jgi:hypothetical protein
LLLVENDLSGIVPHTNLSSLTIICTRKWLGNARKGERDTEALVIALRAAERKYRAFYAALGISCEGTGEFVSCLKLIAVYNVLLRVAHFESRNI